MPAYPHTHVIHRSNWLRAAVMGANDGIVSTASLIMGVAAAGTSAEGVLIAGMASLVAGALSMAAGEYVSVSSQSDTEKAEITKEREALRHYPEEECQELAAIYQQRGLSESLAMEVARELMAKDPLASHARDELGITLSNQARPLQAALVSALTFSLGAVLPLSAVLIMPPDTLLWCIPLWSLASLAVLGFLGAQTGGAPRGRAVMRVVFWGGLAMLLTSLVGMMFE